MRYLFLVVGLVAFTSAAVAVQAPSASMGIGASQLTASAASRLMLPETKGRKGSTRVGGSNNKGKGSRYVGGRR